MLHLDLLLLMVLGVGGVIVADDCTIVLHNVLLSRKLVLMCSRSIVIEVVSAIIHAIIIVVCR